MKILLLCLLAATCISCGGSASESATSREAAQPPSSQRESELAYYAGRAAGPRTEAQTYLNLYTTHKVECESRDSFARNYNCTQAKVDLAHVERAWRQLLDFAEQATQDTSLIDSDRKDAQEVVDRLRSGIERIDSAKPGKLPQL